ncbi:MAG: FG-GAP-like repeat-containing protein, partial [bacterium]|nr:FG-GAP-like repeat-containing protein [bacterium]
MVRTLARTSAIICFLFFALQSTALISGAPKSADSSAFGWRVISFPFEDKIGPTVMFDSANGWVHSGDASRRLYRLHNGNWQVEKAPADIQIWNIVGSSPDNVWLACFNKKNYRYFLRHLDRGTITDYYTPNADRIAKVDFLSPNNSWAVCEWGQIMHFDGTSWQLVPCPAFAHVSSISMANDSCGWAGGKYRNTGFLLHWNGKRWQIKMQQKNLVATVRMVNDTLGWGFLEDDSKIIKLTHDQWALVPFAPLIQDTIVTNWPDVARPIFFNTSGIVTFGGTTTFANQQRDILWSTGAPETPQTKFYLLTHDGKVKYIRQQVPITAKIFWQYAHNTAEGINQEYGVAIGDIDSDGDDDIYSINTSDKNRLQLINGNRQIKMKQPGYFTDGAEHMNLRGPARSKEGETIYDMGATIADMDNDGDRDLYITSMYEKNMLYENIKGINFKEIAKEARLEVVGTRSQVGIWGDVDNDGDVDLFVTNEDTTNMLFLNNGFGKFREITHLAAL